MRTHLFICFLSLALVPLACFIPGLGQYAYQLMVFNVRITHPQVLGQVQQLVRLPSSSEGELCVSGEAKRELASVAKLAERPERRRAKIAVWRYGYA